MLNSLRFRLPALFLAGIALSGLVTSLIAVQLVMPVFTAWVRVPSEVIYAIGAVSSLGWIALALAFVAGLGRGRVRRDGPPHRMRLYVLNPTA